MSEFLTYLGHPQKPIAELFNLEPEEFAGLLLGFLNSQADSPKTDAERGQLFLKTLTGDVSVALARDPNPKLFPALERCICEAWNWLLREGLLADRGEGWCFITQRGRKIRDAAALDAFHKSNMLPKRMLHPVVVAAVGASFLRGKYDEAVYAAYREIEVAVRKAGGFANTDYGDNLMRKAFAPLNAAGIAGPLTNQAAPAGEQSALAHLFAGCIGYFRNPSAHRPVITDPVDAVEMIMMASHLMKIVEERATAIGRTIS